MFDNERIKPSRSEDQEFEELTREEKAILATDAIRKFFLGKSLRIGGRIPDKYLYSSHVIDMVLDVDTIEAVDRVYAGMAGRTYEEWQDAPPQERLHWGPETTEEIYQVQNESTVLPSVKKVLNILSKIAERKIHKRFSPGIMLLYFKHCEWLKIR